MQWFCGANEKVTVIATNVIHKIIIIIIHRNVYHIIASYIYIWIYAMEFCDMYPVVCVCVWFKWYVVYIWNRPLSDDNQTMRKFQHFCSKFIKLFANMIVILPFSLALNLFGICMSEWILRLFRTFNSSWYWCGSTETNFTKEKFHVRLRPGHGVSHIEIFQNIRCIRMMLWQVQYKLMHVLELLANQFAKKN